MIGIYKIQNIINNKCYYGSSKNVEFRMRRHKRDLNKGNHHNILLQRAWNKYGEPNFIFQLVEECSEKLLLKIEQKYLDNNDGYNICLTASGGDNLTNNPNREVIIKNIKASIRSRYKAMSDDEKIKKFSKPKEKNLNWKGGVSVKLCVCGKKISPINKTCSKCRDRNGEKNSFFGKKHSDKTIKKLREARVGKKPGNIKKISIKGVEYESITKASELTEIPKPTILWRIKSKNKKYDEYTYI